MAGNPDEKQSAETRARISSIEIRIVREPVWKQIHIVTRFDLRHQDCIEGMAELPNESIDLVVTSPPYNLAIKYGKYSDTSSRSSYLEWCDVWAAEVRRVLNSDGIILFECRSGAVESDAAA